MNANTSVDSAKHDSPSAIENIATAASSRKQKMMFKKLVMRRKTLSVPMKKTGKKPINKNIESPPQTDIDENPRSLFSKFFQDKESRSENVHYTDSVSCRSRLRTALDETTTHKRSICIFEEEEDDVIHQKYSTSTLSTSESDMSVRTGDDWTSYYRERRLQRRKQPSSVKKLLQRRRFTTSGTSITSAPARILPSRIDEMGFATFT